MEMNTWDFNNSKKLWKIFKLSFKEATKGKLINFCILPLKIKKNSKIKKNTKFSTSYTNK
jgi:hypothetical protein